MKKTLLFFSISFLLSVFSVEAQESYKPTAPANMQEGWKLTFHDEFEGPRKTLNDWYWFTSYRAGRKLWFQRQGIKSRFKDPNANYTIENGILKLQLDRKFPLRDSLNAMAVSSIQTSDHRYGKSAKEYQILDKFSQKYGWFEVRSRMPEGSGLHSAFWLLQHDPLKQEYAEDGRRRKVGEGVVEIDIFEQLGRKTKSHVIDFNVHFTTNGGYEHNLGFDPSKDFHTYALEWKEGELNWYVDGKKVRTYTGKTPEEKMFIILGLYQNGVPDWTGLTQPDMPYPRDFEIDYVRVFSR